jgi:ectoine hydroxylase-related dioxygenase (phytanoyl-CoA dioxygenase family)
MDAFFAAHGWMVVRGAVPEERVRALAAAVDEVIAPSRYGQAGGRVLEVTGASRTQPAIAAHVRDPAIARQVAQALGCRRVQLLQDTVLVKPPDAGRVEWHQDHTYTGFLDPPAVVSVRLALTPCTVETGCLNVLDGSHVWGLAGEPRILNAERVTDELERLGPESAERVRAATRALELAPGDLSLHHCLTLHGSLENRSRAARKTLIARMFDGECRLVRSRLPSPAASVWFPTDASDHLSPDAFPILYEEH